MIRYTGFTKRFGGLVAVRELDLTVAAGEAVGVIGPNGSGKTTSLKAALGLVRPSAGSVLVAGHDATREGRSARARLGYLPQRLTFPEGTTARETMTFFARIRGADQGEIGRLLERVGLAEAADRTAETFSGGMRQRLGLAIALLGAPSALILDEPTAALDPSGSLMVRDLVEAIRAEGTTVLISSHDLAEVGVLADRIAIFVAGRLAAVGSRDELIRQLGLSTRLRVELPAGGEMEAGRGGGAAGVGKAEGMRRVPEMARVGKMAGVAGGARAEPAGRVGGTAADLSGGPPLLAAAIARAGGRRIRWEAGTLRCETEVGREAAILEALRQAGVAASGISVTVPGLEEVYRAVTASAPGAESGGRPRGTQGPRSPDPGIDARRGRPARARETVSGGAGR